MKQQQNVKWFVSISWVPTVEKECDQMEIKRVKPAENHKGKFKVARKHSTQAVVQQQTLLCM